MGMKKNEKYIEISRFQIKKLAVKEKMVVQCLE